MADKIIHRTANGKEINMETIILRNEKVRAVGNMHTNARGDVLDDTNKTTSSRSAQVNKSYRKQTGNIPQDVPVTSSKKAAIANAEEIARQYASTTETITGLDDEESA